MSQSTFNEGNKWKNEVNSHPHTLCNLKSPYQRELTKRLVKELLLRNYTELEEEKSQMG